MENHSLSKTIPAVHGTSADIGTLAGILRRGFDDEPVQKWLFPNGYYRAAASELWFRGMLNAALKQNTVWRLRDNSATAVWFQPGDSGKGAGLGEKLFSLLIKIDKRAARIKEELDYELDIRRPSEPHWYLAAVATETRHRSLGHGKTVLLPALDICDRDHVLAYLETSTPRSLKFYESLGFNVWTAFSLRNGPDIWCLGRRLPVEAKSQ